MSTDKQVQRLSAEILRLLAAHPADKRTTGRGIIMSRADWVGMLSYLCRW